MRQLTKSDPKYQARSLPVFDQVFDWIDRELSSTYRENFGRGGNCLLQLRQVFRAQNLNEVLGRFYRLLPKLERHNFLLSYRIRQWISLNFQVVLSDPLERITSQAYPILQSQKSLRDLKRHFFEHAVESVSMSDIRVAVRRLP